MNKRRLLSEWDFTLLPLQIQNELQKVVILVEWHIEQYLPKWWFLKFHNDLLKIINENETIPAYKSKSFFSKSKNIVTEIFEIIEWIIMDKLSQERKNLLSEKLWEYFKDVEETAYNKRSFFTDSPIVINKPSSNINESLGIFLRFTKEFASRASSIIRDVHSLNQRFLEDVTEAVKKSDYFQALSNTKVFAWIDPVDMLKILNHTKKVTLNVWDIIMNQGEYSNYVYIIEEWLVNIEVWDKIIWVVWKWDIIWEMSTIQDSEKAPASATVKVKEKWSALIIQKLIYKESLQSMYQFWRNQYIYTSNRLHSTTRDYSELLENWWPIIRVDHEWQIDRFSNKVKTFFWDNLVVWWDSNEIIFSKYPEHMKVWKDIFTQINEDNQGLEDINSLLLKLQNQQVIINDFSLSIKYNFSINDQGRISGIYLYFDNVSTTSLSPYFS